MLMLPYNIVACNTQAFITRFTYMYITKRSAARLLLYYCYILLTHTLT